METSHWEKENNQRGKEKKENKGFNRNKKLDDLKDISSLSESEARE